MELRRQAAGLIQLESTLRSAGCGEKNRRRTLRKQVGRVQERMRELEATAATGAFAVAGVKTGVTSDVVGGVDLGDHPSEVQEKLQRIAACKRSCAMDGQENDRAVASCYPEDGLLETAKRGESS